MPLPKIYLYFNRLRTAQAALRIPRSEKRETRFAVRPPHVENRPLGIVRSGAEGRRDLRDLIRSGSPDSDSFRAGAERFDRDRRVVAAIEDRGDIRFRHPFSGFGENFEKPADAGVAGGAGRAAQRDGPRSRGARGREGVRQGMDDEDRAALLQAGPIRAG